MLFNEKGNTLERFINEVNSEDRNVVLQFIHDVISWLKTRLKGEKVSFKIIRLENRFAAVLRNVDNTNAQKNNTTNDGDVQYLFAGQKSRTSNYSLLDQAIKLEDVGKATSEEIRQQTGWFRGYDGKWRYEINDRDIEVDTTGKFHTNPDIRRQTELFNKVYFDATATEDEIKELQILNKNLKGVIAAPQKLGQLIKHTKLFDAYPWLKDVNIRFEFISERGAYNPVFNEIVLSNHIKLNKEQLTKTLIHEIQHAIQHYEGFASGSNTEYWRNLGIDENELFKYYENTAGEIEARDAAIRWWRTNEARKEKRPDIDRTDVVFASNGSHWLSAKEAQYDPETASVSKQIKNSQDVLNRMNIVGSAVAPENFKTKYEAAQWAISQLKATGYQVDRQNFGKIYFEENDIRKGAEYADTYEEKAAFLLIPKVLKRGIEIGRHGNHKLRQKATVTFAAPVMLNGIRGNMAVVVNLNSNRYKVHRIILPDGTTFKFSTKKEVKQESYQGVTENSSLADTTSFTSNSRISQTNATVNNNISEESENYSSPEQDNDGNSYSFGEIDKEGNAKKKLKDRISGDELLNAYDLIEEIESVGGEVDEHGYVTVYHRTNETSKEQILRKGIMLAKEDGVFFSTKINGQAEGYGNSVIKMKIPVEKLILDDIFSDEAHLRYPLYNKNATLDVSQYISVDDNNAETDGTRGTQQNKTTDKAGLNDSAFSMPENDDVEYSFEDDVVDKTSNLAERVRLGEISQTEYLNELQQLMNEATEKYGAIPKGENPKVDVTVPKQVSDKRNTRRFVRTVLESGALT